MLSLDAILTISAFLLRNLALEISNGVEMNFKAGASPKFDLFRVKNLVMTEVPDAGYHYLTYDGMFIPSALPRTD